jgi:hypothetical protein
MVRDAHYAIDCIWLFALIMAVSILFNDKVLIVFAVWISLRSPGSPTGRFSGRG